MLGDKQCWKIISCTVISSAAPFFAIQVDDVLFQRVVVLPKILVFITPLYLEGKKEVFMFYEE